MVLIYLKRNQKNVIITHAKYTNRSIVFKEISCFLSGATVFPTVIESSN